MATTTHLAAPARPHTPFALWHLLSLDAPTVAALWTWFIARSAGIRLPAASPLAMALAVWIIYAADRLLDAAHSNTAGLEARHRFHHRHRRIFLGVIAVSAVALGALLPLLSAAALRLYLVEGALLFAWFLILHSTRRAHRMPKEIAVGIFFSAAVFIPTVSRNPALRLQFAPVALLFAALCALNCLFIFVWEQRGIPVSTVMPHATTRFALQRLPTLAAALVLSGAAFALFSHNARGLVALACALSAALLHALDRYRGSLSRIHLRAAADLALLTPLLFSAFTMPPLR